jgi:hypothetical protein
MIVLQYADHRGRGEPRWLFGPALAGPNFNAAPTDARRERATNVSISVIADTGRVQVLRAF